MASIKRALAAYVSGRNGGWDAELKLDPSTDRSTVEAEPALIESAAATFGVPVPERLAFERGPGTWRRRLGEASHV